jgi:hypothetical protein
MIAYKLLRIRRNGTLGSLFIARKDILPTGVWLDAEEIPTKGFAPRFGWHCLKHPNAPHLHTILASGEVREWFEVQIDRYSKITRPASQGGVWYLADRMKILKPTDSLMLRGQYAQNRSKT